MKPLSSETIKIIEHLLAAQTGILWKSVYSEVQHADGSSFYADIQLEKEPTQDELQKIRETIFHILGPRLPRGQEFLTWIVGVRVGEESFDTLTDREYET